MTAETAKPVIPERCPCCRVDLIHGAVVGMHEQGCELAAAEVALAEALKERDYYRAKFTTDYDLTKTSDQIRELQQQVTQQAATISELEAEVAMYRHLNPNTRRKP